MKISFSPLRSDGQLDVIKAGDVLTINGEQFDFSPLPDGATIASGIVPCEWIAGPVKRAGGDLQLTLVLPHGASPSRLVAFPAPLINPADGPLEIPRDPKPLQQEEPADVEG